MYRHRRSWLPGAHVNIIGMEAIKKLRGEDHIRRSARYRHLHMALSSQTRLRKGAYLESGIYQVEGRRSQPGALIRSAFLTMRSPIPQWLFPPPEVLRILQSPAAPSVPKNLLTLNKCLDAIVRKPCPSFNVLHQARYRTNCSHCTAHKGPF